MTIIMASIMAHLNITTFDKTTQNNMCSSIVLMHYYTYFLELVNCSVVLRRTSQ